MKLRQQAAAVFEPIARFPQLRPFGWLDQTVDGYFDARLRGRPAIDRVMYGASAVGDHGMIWLAIAALDGYRSRRSGLALVRAGAALGLESLLVNGLIKQAFRRHRPQSDEPRPLPLRVPRTSSFPSGHASSAFFAAMLLRDSPAAPAVFAAAAVVAASRVHVRMHHASDVVAGALLGAALGELARRLYPILPPQEQTVP
jgi:undecaprenyl-diphosphatase